MITLARDERILLVIHKHWFVVLGTVVAFFMLLLLPLLVLVALFLLPYGLSLIEAVPVPLFPLIYFLLALYVMLLLLFFFIFWMDYYLDMWIVTTARIIDVEQRGLFRREVSEIPLQHVQDVTTQVHGIIRTFLKFGTIRIQTAGEREFLIDEVPHLEKIKEIILNQAHQ